VSQFRDTLPVPGIRRAPYAGFHPAATVAMALVVAFVLGAAVGVNLRGTAGADPVSQAVQQEVTDGWMSSIASVHAARRAAVTTDGWAARYLPSERMGGVTDGWAGRFLPSASGGSITDGWASRYLPSAQGH
jgi:hypothetical protein